jgi:hypothetical protein
VRVLSWSSSAAGNVVLMNAPQCNRTWGCTTNTSVWAVNLTQFQWQMQYDRRTTQIVMENVTLVVPQSEFQASSSRVYVRCTSVYVIEVLVAVVELLASPVFVVLVKVSQVPAGAHVLIVGMYASLCCLQVLQDYNATLYSEGVTPADDSALVAVMTAGQGGSIPASLSATASRSTALTWVSMRGGVRWGGGTSTHRGAGEGGCTLYPGRAGGHTVCFGFGSGT